MTLTLHNGVEIPRLGLGVWKIANAHVATTVLKALEIGYRHIDTARAYKNEEGVGKGIKESGLPRNELFVTTKLAVFDFHRPEKAFLDSLTRLQMDYVDLYLLHWPFLGWKKAWGVLEEIYKGGKAKAIGVSNFGIKQLEELKRVSTMKPMVNQVEISPFLTRENLIQYCQAEGIAVEAYSPLTRGKRLNDPVIIDIAKKYSKSAAQIMIRWSLQHNLIVIPKAETKEHLESDFNVFDFELQKEDVRKMDALNENYSALIPYFLKYQGQK